MTAPASAPATTPPTSARTDNSHAQPRRTASTSAPASAEKLAALAQLGVGGLRGALSSGAPAPSGRGAQPDARTTPAQAKRPDRGQRPDAGYNSNQQDRPARTPKAGQRDAMRDMPRDTNRPTANRPSVHRPPANHTSAPRPESSPAQRSGAAPRAPVRSHPLLEKLADLYPRHFGAVFLPLKRGIFQDVLAAHPDVFDKAELKVALGIHTRSSRYLQAVASGTPRHDLQGQPVEAVAPEHIHHAVLEIFRRRQMRAEEDLSPQLRQRIGRVFEASGLTAEQYAQRVHSRTEATNALVALALQETTTNLEQAQAVHDAWQASGATVADFAQAQGGDARAVSYAVERTQRHAAARLAAEQAAAAAQPVGESGDAAAVQSEDGITAEPHAEDEAQEYPATQSADLHEPAPLQPADGVAPDTAPAEKA